MHGRCNVVFCTGRSKSIFAAGIMALALLIVVAGPNPKSPAELQGPGAMERSVALTVRTLLERDHLLERKVDDTIADRAAKTFLRQLDPLKVYFYQSDVDKLLERRSELDNDLQRGDIDFAYDAYKVFLERVDQRLETIESLLEGSFDFTIDEQLITEPDERDYPKNPAEARDLWRKRLKYDLLVLASEETSDDEARDRLRRRYTDFARRMRHATDDDLLERYLSAFSTSFDPHTSYMSKSTLEDFRISMRLNLEGIGAALRSEDGYVILERVLPGGAAAKHGELKPEDQIVSVGQGSDGEMVDVVEYSLKEVVNLIRGKAGTVVRLGVKSPGSAEIQIHEITRARIELTDEEAQARVFEAGAKPDGSPYKIGVIDLPSFYMDMTGAQLGLTNYKSTTRDVSRILGNFEDEGVDAVVLDLRQNGGGSLTEAVNLTGLFVDQGPIVQVKDSDERVQQYDDTRPGTSWEGPLVVVTDKFSASASEILAGAIQDYRRGLVVGDSTTHGKGTVQHLLELGRQLFPNVPNIPNLGALKITIQKFYRPSGKSTQLRGVPADIVLPSFTDVMEDVAESDLDFPIDYDTVESAQPRDYNMVSDKIIRDITKVSKQRQANSDDFQKLLSDIRRYEEQRTRNRVPLSKEKFIAMREEFDARKEEEKQLEKQIPLNGEVIERDYYLDEVLAITADYVSALRNGHKLANAEQASN